MNDSQWRYPGRVRLVTCLVIAGLVIVTWRLHQTGITIPAARGRRHHPVPLGWAAGIVVMGTAGVAVLLSAFGTRG